MLRICSKECVTDTKSTLYYFAAWQGKQGNVEKNSQHLWLPRQRNMSSTMISEAHDGAPGLFGRPGTHTALGRPHQSTEGPRPKHGNRREPTMERRRARRPSGGAQVSGGLVQAASEGITDVSRRRFPLLSSSALTHCTAPDNWTLDSWRANQEHCSMFVFKAHRFRM